MQHKAGVKARRREARLLGLASCSVLLWAWSAPRALCEQEIVVGAVSAANAAPTGRAPGKATRVLSPGADIYFKDRIATKRGGAAQLTFMDRSTLNVGENSDLVIDEFIYKPGTSGGTMKATLTRGMLRFVGGEVSHSGGTEVVTPTVTIGIRGGIGTIGYIKDAPAIPGAPQDFHGGTIIINSYGTLTVRNSISEQVISRPGFAVFVGSGREAIAAPVRFNDAAMRVMMKMIAGGRPPPGGASSHIAASVVATLPARGLGLNDGPARTAPGVNALDYTSTFSAGNALARNRSQSQQAGQLQVALASQAASRAAAAALQSTAANNMSPASTGATTSGSTGTNIGSGGNAPSSTVPNSTGSSITAAGTGTNSTGSNAATSTAATSTTTTSTAATSTAATSTTATSITSSNSTGSSTAASPAGASATGSNSTGSSNAGNTGTGSTGAANAGTTSMATSGSLTGSLNSHDINATTVTANTIYAHEIDAQHINGVIHLVNGGGNGNGKDGDVSTTTVQSGTIDAHDIHATTVTASDIYVQSINGN